MTIKEQEILTNTLDKASFLYYNGGQSTLTDTEFDIKMHELAKAEKENNYIFPNSPTQRVGTDAIDSFAKIKHPIPMLTIENTYDDSGLQEWVNKMEEKYGVKWYNISVKYDGISCELHYKDGKLISASTRGDKNIGDNITANARTIKSIPLTLDIDYDFYVRGEILLPKSKLSKINEERIANGEMPFANTRNACSGSIKQLDSKITAKRGLIFRAWDCFWGGDCEQPLSTMTEKGFLLERLGFIYDKKYVLHNDINAKDDYVDTVPFRTDDVVKDVAMFKAEIKDADFDFDYDGVVIKVDDLNIQDKIGIKDTRAIEWGIARKWNEEYIAETVLLGVEWQVGRTGVLTPVGELKPVSVDGVIVSNVTLHNIDFIRDKDLMIGDTVRITRSGGVIPYVLGRKDRSENLTYYGIIEPHKCPICGGEVIRDGALLKCTNDNCKAKIIGEIIQFCSKECCDIRSMGEKVIEDLYDAELITSIGDLTFQAYRASIDSCKEYDIKEWIKALGEGYGEKSVRNMMDAMAYARLNTPYEKVISGLSIPGVGKTMARALCKKYDSVFDLERATVESLMEIDGIAEITAKNIYNWLHSEKAYILNRLDSDGWNWMAEAYDVMEEDNEGEDKPLDGLKVCFTGKSFKFKGDEVEDYLKKNGAEIGSVSKSLNYLIIGEKPGGSKVTKAKDLGIEIISESDFYEKYKLF